MIEPEIEYLKSEIAELEEMLDFHEKKGWGSLIHKRDSLLALYNLKHRLSESMGDADAARVAGIIHSELIEIEGKLGGADPDLRLDHFRQTQLPKKNTPKNELKRSFAEEHPVDGNRYWVNNPFVDVSVPSPRLSAIRVPNPQVMINHVRFKDYAKGDERTHWEFAQVGHKLFHIRNLYMARLFGPTSYCLLKRAGSSGTTLVYADGSAEDGDKVVWLVDYSDDGTAYNIRHPDRADRMLYSRFIGGEYHALCGRPELWAGDVHLELIGF